MGSPLPNILIVDDTPANLKVLTELFKRSYRARPVASGRQALQAARDETPDLILLDINMPEMNGFEVCERLKADELLKKIPVLFVSAFNDTANIVKAFAVGGVDYVTKPFQLSEVEARVRTHLELRRQKLELEASYKQLMKMEQLRDNLTHMIVHDLRNPLNIVCMALELFEMPGNAQLTAKGSEHLRTIKHASRRLLEMINSVLDVSKLEAGEMKLALGEVDLGALGLDALARIEPLKKNRRLELDVTGGPIVVRADRELIARVFQNLLDNALKFTPNGGSIRNKIERGMDHVRIEFGDNGAGIPSSLHERIFEKFAQVDGNASRNRQSTGLGLTFCKLVVEAHGGQIGVSSEVGRGSTFWILLPVAGPPSISTTGLE